MSMKLCRTYLVSIPLLLTVLQGPSAGTSERYHHGDPSDEEQYALELINRARLNPAAEGRRMAALSDDFWKAERAAAPAIFARLAADLAAFPAVPPLAFQPALMRSARGHAADMSRNEYMSHTDRRGRDPTTRARAEKYDGAGVGENISGMLIDMRLRPSDIERAHYGLLIDHRNAMHAELPFGHRRNVLHAPYSEAGVGAVGSLLVQNFGLRQDERRYVTGVVYNDHNGNGEYDPGEGLAGVDVRLNVPAPYHAVTSASGGYAFPYTHPAGTAVSVVASGGQLTAVAQRSVRLAAHNVKVDFVIVGGSDGRRVRMPAARLSYSPPGSEWQSVEFRESAVVLLLYIWPKSSTLETMQANIILEVTRAEHATPAETMRAEEEKMRADSRARVTATAREKIGGVDAVWHIFSEERSGRKLQVLSATIHRGSHVFLFSGGALGQDFERHRATFFAALRSIQFE